VVRADRRAVAGGGGLGDAGRARWRDVALAVALAAGVLVAYRGFAGGGRVADEAYRRFVVPSVAAAPR
jgi:hypothetical protein